MAKVSYTKFDLGYPPWALDFDPYNRGYLLVGGGGGEGQKEVPNRLTLLDITSPAFIEKVADLDVIDDSPVSLGVLSTKEGLYAYSGINSGAADRKKSKNEHFRSFKVDYPQRSKEQAEKKASGSISQLGQTSIFSPSFCSATGDQFQRLLRLSPAQKRSTGNKRIGAIANSLAPESEIVVFNATSASPTSADVIQRIQPLQNAEANDIDILEQEEGEFLVAYCTQSEIYLTSISYDFATRKPKAPLQEPACLYSAPFPDAFQKPGRAKYRSIRFLTPEHLLLLSNVGGQSELHIIRIFSSGGPGECILRKRLPKNMGSAVSMDVCILDADVTTGAKQIVIAVAAQAQDIVVYTLDYAGPVKNTASTFRTYSELKAVHNAPMKKVVLSPFHSPWPPATTPESEKKMPGPQYLRLASISLSNSLVIETLPLHPAEPTKRGSRYILSQKSRTSSILSTGSSLFVAAFVLLITLLLFQSYLNAQNPGSASSIQLLPSSWQKALEAYRSRAMEMSSPLSRRIHQGSDPIIHSHTGQRILDLLHSHHKESKHLPDPEKKAIILSPASEDSDHELATEVHADTAEVLKRDVHAKRWEELSQSQQERWRGRLVKAGAWSADYGETVLKGIFFSEIAGAVGRAAAQAMAGDG